MKSKNQSGYTLTELAIVFALVGLLIGGFLKFSEMIAVTRIKSVALQWDMVKNSVIAFKDKYGDLPGDIRDPDEYISDLRSVDGGATGVDIDGVPSRSTDSADRIICYNCKYLNGTNDDKEFALVWRQLYAAKMLPVKTSRAGDAADVADERFFSELRGAEFFLMTDTDENAHSNSTPVNFDGQANDYGLYLHLLSMPTKNPRSFNTNMAITHSNNTGYFLTAKQAFEIDKKFDDGVNIKECNSSDDPCRTGDIKYFFKSGAGADAKTPFGEEAVAAMQLRVSAD